MRDGRGKRPKLVLYPTRSVSPRPASDASDFAVYPSYRGSSASGYYGTLKVVRKTDGRLLYPFVGAASIGPFWTREEALSAAQKLGEKIVAGDLERPEL